MTTPLPRIVPTIFKRISGVTLYYTNYNVLTVMIDNPNYVVLLSNVSNPDLPAYYIRACEFIDMITLMESGLVECSSEWKLSPMLYLAQQEIDLLISRAFNKEFRKTLEDAGI